jgi:hypothetical protein
MILVHASRLRILCCHHSVHHAGCLPVCHAMLSVYWCTDITSPTLLNPSSRVNRVSGEVVAIKIIDLEDSKDDIEDIQRVSGGGAIEGTH